MWRRIIVSGEAAGGAPCRSWRTLATKSKPAANSKPSSGGATASSSAAVDSLILRSLKDHYLEVSKMVPPPKVSPPSPFTIVKGALDGIGPVLRRSYGEGAGAEEISISVMRLANIIPGGGDDGDDDGQSINQLFLHVDIAKPGWKNHLHFLCGLYPDALGIHSVALRPKVGGLTGPAVFRTPTKYAGPAFQ